VKSKKNIAQAQPKVYQVHCHAFGQKAGAQSNKCFVVLGGTAQTIVLSRFAEV